MSSSVTGPKSAERSPGQVDTALATPPIAGSFPSVQGQNKPEAQDTVPCGDDDEEWPDNPPDDSDKRGKRDKPTTGAVKDPKNVKVKK